MFGLTLISPLQADTPANRSLDKLVAFHFATSLQSVIEHGSMADIWHRKIQHLLIAEAWQMVNVNTENQAKKNKKKKVKLSCEFVQTYPSRMNLQKKNQNETKKTNT